MTNYNNIQDSEKVPIITNWVGCKGLRFVQMLSDEEEECKTNLGLFKILSDHLKP